MILSSWTIEIAENHKKVWMRRKIDLTTLLKRVNLKLKKMTDNAR